MIVALLCGDSVAIVEGVFESLPMFQLSSLFVSQVHVPHINSHRTNADVLLIVQMITEHASWYNITVLQLRT